MKNKGMKKRSIPTPKKKKKLRFKKWVWKVFLTIFLIITIVSLISLYFWKNSSNKTKDLEKEINEIAKVKEETTTTPEVTTTTKEEEQKNNDYWKYIETDMLNINFNELKKKNKDTVAWIKVNGTNVNYPVVQTSNNEYYLKHAYDGSYNKAGWIYADYRNNLNTLDKNNVIYGHGRVDKTMFGSLRSILSNAWFKNKKNHIVTLATPSYNSTWQVFSVYKIKAESYYITTKFPNDEQFIEFSNTLTQRSKFNFNTNMNNNDKILTLSTCLDSHGTRIVLHAKLIDFKAK